jgi:hypothetical protein
MPGSEFRLLPMLPLEYKQYKVCKPRRVGSAMTKGWTPVASINFTDHIEGVGFMDATLFLIGKDLKEAVEIPRGRAIIAGPPELSHGPHGPEIGFQQPGDEFDLPPSIPEAPAVEEPSEEEPPPVEAQPDSEVDEVRREMDELLDGVDDGSSDDDPAGP